MTTNPTAREDYWRGLYPNLRDWAFVQVGLTREQAQQTERSRALLHGCDQGDGGAEPANPFLYWSVYHFYYN